MSESPLPRNDSELRDQQTTAVSGGFQNDSESLADWQSVFEQSKDGLRAFVQLRLRQASDVDDCLQAVYLKMIESPHCITPAARRAWLFRVAANEAAKYWRSQELQERAIRKLGCSSADTYEPVEQVIRGETVEQVTGSIERLPPAWREVVRLRIHENMTFQEISQTLGIPLGTALTQMRRALERIRSEMRDGPQ
jgi:RNA polymerase sigma-70 factor (ECF subfamily)